MKVQASVKEYPGCPDCQTVRRKKKRRAGGPTIYVTCKKGKHKQRQG